MIRAVPRVAEILQAMRADSVPEGERGLWRVKRWSTPVATRNPDGRLISPGTYTSLLRWTSDTLHRGGAVVMSDDGHELRQHLQFVLRARGRVLVTGLGLGCVVRGLIAAGQVSELDVVERDGDVWALVAPHLPAVPGRTLHRADALAFITQHRPEATWDFAWHDIWSDPDAGEKNLVVTHSHLMMELRGRVGWQGAWSYPRYLRRTMRQVVPDTAAWGKP